jgi:hypothetical protein
VLPTLLTVLSNRDAELETVVASGFPDVLSVSGRCNAPLLVDWLVDTVFALEDAQPPEVKGWVLSWLVACNPHCWLLFMAAACLHKILIIHE